MEAVLSQHRESEKNLQATMMTAQKLSDDIKANAEAEARRIIAAADAEARRVATATEAESKRMMRDAESRSDLLLEKTQSRLEDIQREIDGLRLKRKDVETTLEASIQALRNTLEYIREQDGRDRDERILLHRPRQSDSSDDADAQQPRKIAG
jgi:cell division septum initiation protein DivIVA